MTDEQFLMLLVSGVVDGCGFVQDAKGKVEIMHPVIDAIPLPGKVDDGKFWCTGSCGGTCRVCAKPTYTTGDFKQHMEDVFEDVLDTLVTKSTEYAKEEDTFATLKQIAKAWGEPPRKVALKLALKHYMSLLHEGDNLSPMQRRDRLSDIHVYIEMAELNWEEK